MLKSLALLVFIVGASSIGVGIDSYHERCMIVSSNNQQHTLKLDAKFEPFDHQTSQEGYRIVLHNTETHEQLAFQTGSGVFRRQFTLAEDVVYRLCFKIVVADDREVSNRMEYQAAVKHSIEQIEPLIKVPEKLLKSHDLSQTYTYLQKTKQLVDTLQSKVDQVRSQEVAAFQAEKEKIQTLEWISIVEILVICLFGGYQFIKLKQIISTRRNT